MFYARPKIEPLGWDLVNLPTESPDSTKHYDGLTSDRRPIDFQFSGGWLTVERGAVDAPRDGGPMEEILSVPIAPFGTMDIDPEQICDILGITVNGRKISAFEGRGARSFDWSGETTYWESTHLMDYYGDAERFVKELSRTFPDAVLVQPVWEESAMRLKWRQIKFLMRSDENVTIGMGFNKAKLEQLLAAEEISTAEYENAFSYKIDFRREDRPYHDVTRKKLIDAKRPGLNYSVMNHKLYRIQMQFYTEDLHAQFLMKELLSVIDRYFSRGFQLTNIETGEVIGEDLTDPYDTKSYSNTLRDRCLARPKEYLFVSASDWPDSPISGKDLIFFGARPLKLIE